MSKLQQIEILLWAYGSTREKTVDLKKARENYFASLSYENALTREYEEVLAYC